MPAGNSGFTQAESGPKQCNIRRTLWNQSVNIPSSKNCYAYDFIETNSLFRDSYISELRIISIQERIILVHLFSTKLSTACDDPYCLYPHRDIQKSPSKKKPAQSTGIKVRESYCILRISLKKIKTVLFPACQATPTRQSPRC